MDEMIAKVLTDQTENYILPFLWMKGETHEVIREEIDKIHACGIGAVCLESRPHPDFMGPQWWADVDYIIALCKERGMKVWILDDSHFPTGYANGLVAAKYPELKKQYIDYSTADVWSRPTEVTIPVRQMTKKLFNFFQPETAATPEENAQNRLIAVLAVKMADKKIADETQVLDLTDLIADGEITYAFPEGAWRVFVVFRTPSGPGNRDYINMLDSASCRVLLEAVYEPHYEHLKDEFGKTVLGFFYDEPGFGNNHLFEMNEIIGKPDLALLWSDEAEEEYRKRMGADWKKSLPFLWTDSAQRELQAQARFSYMDMASYLYGRNFSDMLGRWCEDHGVLSIGHVIEDRNMHSKLGVGAGHYFRATGGQHMAGVDIISDQVAFGGFSLTRGGLADSDGEFLHYALAKLGSSQAAVDPKKQGRALCEIYGAYGWRFGVRDMKWVLDHALVQGINVFVPHAFSMADYPDPDCPPHFYARGNNPEYAHFGDLMRYMNRMSELFSGGRPVIRTAVLYQAEGEWAGDYLKMQEIARVLTCHQIDFNFLPMDAVLHPENYNGSCADGRLTINGVTYEALVVPYAEKLPAEFLRFVEDTALPVLFAGGLPEGSVSLAGAVGQSADDQALTEAVRAKARCVSPEELPEALDALGAKEIYPDRDAPHFYYRHYLKDGMDLYLFFNEDPDRAFEGEIRLPLKKGAVYLDIMDRKAWQMPLVIGPEPEDPCDCEGSGPKPDPACGRDEAAQPVPPCGRDRAALPDPQETAIRLELPVYGSCVILDAEPDDDLPIWQSGSELLAGCETADLSQNWEVSAASAKQYPEFTPQGEMTELVPFSRVKRNFSGHIAYEKTFTPETVRPKAYLEIEKAGELVDVWVNGTYAGYRLTPPYLLDISGLLREGENTIRIEVTTTADRDQLNYPEGIAMDYMVMEATGMYGRITLYQRKNSIFDE